jgi:extracellular solute-binding protein (family 5)
MKLRLCLLLAVTSILLSALPAGTARRPRYGGTLRVEISAAIRSLDPALAAPSQEIALAKNQIDALLYDHREADGTFSGMAGSGAFRIAEWEPGKQVILAANQDYPEGRAFVDSIEIQMARPTKDRLLDLELNRTDLAEIPAEEARRAAERGVRLSPSQPDELVALAFVLGRPAAGDPRIREALARAVDRASIANFILQKQGEPAGGLLPQWSSGTAFLFSAEADPSGAKEQWSRIPGSPKISLGYDSGDGLAQLVAERIMVNAREVGIPLTAMATSGGLSASLKTDARLIRLRMPSAQPRAALASFLAELGPLSGVDPSSLPDPALPEQVYERERMVVNSYCVIPLVWLPRIYGLSARVRDWKAPSPGETWPLADVWLDTLDGTGSPNR